MKRSAHLLLCLMVGAATAPTVHALIPYASLNAAIGLQSRNSITGYVFAETRRPVADIFVELLNDVYSTIGRMKTNGAGFYAFRNLPEGYYKVRVLPYGTDYTEQTRDVTIINVSAVPGSGATNEQLDFYLKVKETATHGPFGAPAGAVFAQEVPKEAKKLYEQGVAELSQKKEKEGFESLRNALDLFPNYYLALDRLGTEYAIRGQNDRRYYEAARILLTKALEVNPRSYSSRCGLGYVCYHLGHTEEAVENLKHAVGLYNASANGHLWLGIALKKAGNMQEAEAALLRARELSKGKAAEVHWQLAGLYGDQKRYREAADALELFLKTQPDVRDAEKIKQLIRQLREKAAAAS